MIECINDEILLNYKSDKSSAYIHINNVLNQIKNLV